MWFKIDSLFFLFRKFDSDILYAIGDEYFLKAFGIFRLQGVRE